jgi:D-alanyl-D-alanine carboxypeptidase
MSAQIRRPRWLAPTVLAVAVGMAAVPGSAGAQPAQGPTRPSQSSTTAASASLLPPLDPTALNRVVTGLPAARITGALVRVSGSAGQWSGGAGVADLRTGQRFGPTDRFRIGSVSKTFVATVVLQLVAEHRIALDRPIQSYLPGLLPAADQPVTVAELLNHTSGFGQVNGIVHSGDPQWFLANRLNTFSTAQLLGSVLRQPLLNPPGTHQQYNGVNYLVLGMLIERVTGHGYAQEIQQRILSPLGLRDTSVPSTDPNLPGPHAHGYYQPTSGSGLIDVTEQNPTLYGAQGDMISTTNDLDRFVTALFSGQLLPPAQLTDLFTVPPAATGPIQYSMGLLTTTLPNGVRVWGHTGETPGYASGMLVTRDLARKVVYAFTPIGPGDNQVLGAVQAILSAADDPASG